MFACRLTAEPLLLAMNNCTRPQYQQTASTSFPRGLLPSTSITDSTVLDECRFLSVSRSSRKPVEDLGFRPGFRQVRVRVRLRSRPVLNISGRRPGYQQAASIYRRLPLQPIDINDPKYFCVQDGKKRKLRVANISSKDEGFYKCKVQDKVTSAKLYVARMYVLSAENLSVVCLSISALFLISTKILLT